MFLGTFQPISTHFQLYLEYFQVKLDFFCSGRAWIIFLLGKGEIKSEKAEKMAKNGKNVEKQQFFGSSGVFFSSRKVFIGTHHHIMSPHRGLGGYFEVSREKVDFIQIWSSINIVKMNVSKMDPKFLFNFQSTNQMVQSKILT